MRIAVLYGGTNIERDVSIATAGQVIRALRTRGHDVVPFDTAKGRLTPAEEEALLNARVAVQPPHWDDIPQEDMTSRLIEDPDGLRSVDVVFLALHGGSGEDGTLQAILDGAGICYTGSGTLASSIAMDKDISKRLIRFAGIPTPDWLMMSSSSSADADTLGLPLVVKPNKEGSTMGLTVVKEDAQLASAIQVAFSYGDEVMLERFIPGREFVVGVLDGEPLAVGEIIPKNSEIFDYQSKYQVGGAIEIFPAEISSDDTRRMRQAAADVHSVLKLEAHSRVDFRMDADGGIWCLEANTLPGMTMTSLLPQSASAVGIDFSDLCERICLLALAKR